MAWFAAALPYISAAAGAAGQMQAGQQNEQTLKVQGIVARDQALADEMAQRRQTRQLRGDQAASLAESGLSPDGSSARMADQSAAQSELDALNIRYRGALRGMGLLAEARDAGRSGQMLAGQSLLKSAVDLYKPRARAA